MEFINVNASKNSGRGKLLRNNNIHPDGMNTKNNNKNNIVLALLKTSYTTLIEL